ncbi:Protein arginine N-methyltransferase 3 [Batrachochytrium dendrobatidis]|nr:Protein arginine N-methyltransferase 3 [Batrachochytrium dendrobatidis]
MSDNSNPKVIDDLACNAESDGSNKDNWSDWEEDHATHAMCPFCPFTDSAPTVFKHLTNVHAFDFHAIRTQLGLDFYGSMRLVNYVRLTLPTVEALLADSKEWLADEKYLIPTIADDALLYAFEDEYGDEPLDNIVTKPDTVDSKFKSVEHSNDELVQSLLAEIQLSHAKLETLTTAFQEYKDQVRSTFLDSQNCIDLPSETTEKIENEWEMDYYFGSYAETEIHETMLKDTVRTEAYRNFIYNNKAYFKDKIVLDVGCGTGILSMFAAKAGAKQVIAVDNSTIIKKAKLIAAANKVDDVITFIAGKIEEIKLPVDKVDVIVSEWMGYFLLFEGMLDSVLHARDLYLAPNGIMAPSHAMIKIAGIEDAEWVNDKLNFWNDVYGFKMDLMKNGFLTDGQVDFADPKSLITDTCTLVEIDTNVVKVSDLDFESDYTMVATKTGTMHAICGWFDIEFRGNAGSGELEMEPFSTGPLTKGTHWKQTMFVLDQAVDVVSGDVITGHFTGVKSPENHRDMVVTITVEIKNRGISRAAKSFNVR